ncbi:MAG: hypothetical protein KGV51_00405 [Moraxellaceae bacterium]|nr:hypothetical protein [Moraxellaceae bacterium]
MAHLTATNYQNHKIPPNLANFPPQVQQILPELSELDLEQKLKLIHFLTNSNPQNRTVQDKTSKQKNINPLGRNYLGDIWVSDDFDEYLGDDFWLGDDNEFTQ